MALVRPAFKLAIELVPSTSWYDNLRKGMKKEEWDGLRRKIYSKHGYRCGICASRGRMNCHEIWSYDDRRHIQKLDGFIALCDWCHHRQVHRLGETSPAGEADVKHIGLASILASRGELDYDLVVEHFMKVNQCSRSAFERHRSGAFAVWEERSKFQWKVVVGNYDKAEPAEPRKARGTQLNLMGEKASR